MAGASSGTGPGEPYRYRRGWSSGARIAATNLLRDAIETAEGLVGVCEAAGEVVLGAMAAETVTVTVLDDDNTTYRDIVNVGELLPEEVRYPATPYPASRYPLATERLLARDGYISADGLLDVVQERLSEAERAMLRCFMGVPIESAGTVLGELYLRRGRQAPVFTPEDLDFTRDLATQLGTRLPDLLKEMRVANPEW